jgi:hypothetical protein
MNKKIDVYINGEYQYSSLDYRTCKEAIADIKSRQSVNVASIPPYTVQLVPGDKVTARIDHNYN